MKRVKTIVTAVALLMALSPLYAEENEVNDVVEVVYQCDFSDVKRVHLMINTLNNAVEYYNQKLIPYEIDIVALGPCLQYFMKDFKKTGYEEKPYLTQGGPTGAGTRARFKNLQMSGGDNVKFFACKNTMDKKNVTESQLEDFVEVTPAGVIKVIDLQREGYAYIKIQ